MPPDLNGQSVSCEDLRVRLESHLPESLPVGSAGALFLYGHCFHRRQRVERLDVLLDGARFRPAAFRMPRRDLYEWLTSVGEDPDGRSYRSGFWLTIPVRAATAGVLELEAVVQLADGTRPRHPLGRVRVAAPESTGARGPGGVGGLGGGGGLGGVGGLGGAGGLGGGTIAVCMATFNPDRPLLGVQLESLRAQTDRRWICLISDGGSDPQRFAEIVELTRGDERFVVSRSEERLGPAHNFERALSMVPGEVELVALCDQDDRWYPDKLAALRDGLGSASLVYSDQRLVAQDGRVLRESLWEGRRNEFRNLASLLVANTAPGAAMLFRRELLDTALPFPEAPGVPYHDHWLALVALARGEISYLDRPLFDWVQHPASVSRGASPSAAPRGSRGWRGAYFAGYVMREVFAKTLLLRCERELTPRKRRALEWFGSAAQSPLAFMWLSLRPLRRLVGRDETLGGELALVRGVLWRWLIMLAVAGARTPGRRAADASFPDPPRFEQARLRRWRAGLWSN